MAEKSRELSGVSFIRALTPFMKSLPSWPYHLPKAPCPNIIILRVKILTYECGGHKQSVALVLLLIELGIRDRDTVLWSFCRTLECWEWGEKGGGRWYDLAVLLNVVPLYLVPIELSNLGLHYNSGLHSLWHKCKCWRHCVHAQLGNRPSEPIGEGSLGSKSCIIACSSVRCVSLGNMFYNTRKGLKTFRLLQIFS